MKEGVLMLFSDTGDVVDYKNMGQMLCKIFKHLKSVFVKTLQGYVWYQTQTVPSDHAKIDNHRLALQVPVGDGTHFTVLYCRMPECPIVSFQFRTNVLFICHLPEHFVL